MLHCWAQTWSPMRVYFNGHANSSCIKGFYHLIQLFMSKKLSLPCVKGKERASQFTRRIPFPHQKKNHQKVSSWKMLKLLWDFYLPLFILLSLQHKFIKSFLVSSYYVHFELFMIFCRPTSKNYSTFIFLKFPRFEFSFSLFLWIMKKVKKLRNLFSRFFHVSGTSK